MGFADELASMSRSKTKDKEAERRILTQEEERGRKLVAPFMEHLKKACEEEARKGSRCLNAWGLLGVVHAFSPECTGATGYPPCPDCPKLTACVREQARNDGFIRELKTRLETEGFHSIKFKIYERQSYEYQGILYPAVHVSIKWGGLIGALRKRI